MYSYLMPDPQQYPIIPPVYALSMLDGRNIVRIRVTEVLNALNKSNYAEQMVCSMSSQLFHIPRTKNLKGNPEMHEHLYEASYHRTTAIGSAIRLQLGERERSIVVTMVSCIQNAEKHDRKIDEWLLVMINDAPADVKPFIQKIIEWQKQAVANLREAKQIIIQDIGNQAWNEIISQGY